MLELYKNIKKVRSDIGMSQDELAQKVGYTSRSTIARIERGDIDLPQSKVIEIAKVLRVSPAYLFGWEDEDGNEIVKEFDRYAYIIDLEIEALNEEGKQKVIEFIGILKGNERFSNEHRIYR